MTDDRITDLADRYEAATPYEREALFDDISPTDAGPLADELERRAAATLEEAAELKRLAGQREREGTPH